MLRTSAQHIRELWDLLDQLEANTQPHPHVRVLLEVAREAKRPYADRGTPP